MGGITLTRSSSYTVIVNNTTKIDILILIKAKMAKRFQMVKYGQKVKEKADYNGLTLEKVLLGNKKHQTSCNSATT